MSQISPPMRIVLAVAIVFAAAYMLVLKPKDEEVAPAPATPVPAAEAGGPEASTSLGQAVEGAREAAGAETAPGTTQAAPEQPSSSSPPEEPAADSALSELPKWLRDSMDRKVVAILFTNNRSADDRRTATALRKSYDDGDVVHRIVPIAKIAAYGAVAEGVDVQQSPTLMVIDRARSAQALVGYSSLDTVNQAIVDALLATDNPRRSVEWLQLAQDECREITNRSIVGVAPGENLPGARRNVDATLATMTSSLGTLRNAPVPAAYRPVKDVLTRYVASEIAIGRQVQGMLVGRVPDPIAVDRALRNNDSLQTRMSLVMNAHGVTSCN